ncbi:asparagine synthetase [glutamine-hydrolyzing] 1 [bacterium MnTg02]|nr:asparagine synthetase [glutamine-hydrolyzing] 1 [bacterium MnTg02]
MCGIAGVFNRDGTHASQSVIQAMIDRIRHRGPDDQGLWHEGPVAFGHRRLAIRDLTPAGSQPFVSADERIVVTYNGELYNDDDLALELEKTTGYIRRTRCDTELIPAAYLAWGLSAFARFEGMFAIALWDRKERRLVLARDGIGIKPLYVRDDGKSISFASEIKALLADTSKSAKLSPPDVAHMLALGYPAPDRTLLEGVRQLAPGTILSVDATGTREHTFWRPKRTPVLQDRNAAKTEFLEIFREVVAAQLVSDVPVGVMQSGGVDSSLISMLLPRDRQVPLFSVRFSEASHDEAKVAASLARTAERKLVWVDFPDSADVEDDFRSSVEAVDGQLADSSTLATYRLCRTIRQHATVALSGDGGDEFFAGYPTYRASALASRISPLCPKPIWTAAARFVQATSGVSNARLPLREKAYRFLSGLGHQAPHAVWRHYLPSWKRHLLYGPQLAEDQHTDPFAGYADALKANNGDIIDKCLVADQTYYLPADMLVKVDRTSMAHGLEVRVPFLDRRVMEFSGRLSNALMLPSGGLTKRILRDALESLGVSSNIAQAPKRGFNVPMNILLSGALKPLASRLLDREADVFAPYLSPDGVRQLWREHSDGRRDEKYAIWALLTIGVWCQKEAIH